MSSVSTTRHISTSCCQSRLLRAKRETSRAATAPTLPRQTSATMRSKPARAVPPAAEQPRSSSMTSISDQPSCDEAVAHGVLQHLALAVVLNLMGGGLADIEHRLAGPVLRADLVSAHRCRRPFGSRAPDGSPACAMSRRVRSSVSVRCVCSGSALQLGGMAGTGSGLAGRDRVDGAAGGAGDEGCCMAISTKIREMLSSPLATPPMARAHRVRSRARNAASADSAAAGCAVARAVRQDAASSIQTGISCSAHDAASTRLQRAAAPVARSITS